MISRGMSQPPLHRDAISSAFFPNDGHAPAASPAHQLIDSIQRELATEPCAFTVEDEILASVVCLEIGKILLLMLLNLIDAENVHALEGLAFRKRVAPASSPAAPASRVRRSRRLRSTLAAAPGLLAHALVTKQ